MSNTGVKMPALFVGHGSPMNAIEDNEFSQAWAKAGSALPRPRAILCISAHWQGVGTQVTGMERPPMIYDFYGFPQQLSQVKYPAPGSPELARLVRQTVSKTRVGLDMEWGLDHGAWSVLCRMFPQADIPVVQLCLDHTKSPAFHYALGQELRALRRQGILILGSGNVVHNLGTMGGQDEAYDWASEFDAKIARTIQAQDHHALIHYHKLGKAAQMAIPTNEHYLPLLYVLALQEADEPIAFFAERVTLGSISMRSLRIG